MCRSSYCIKVDLSKLYNDARCLSRLYVDKETINCVFHVQNRIMKIFDLRTPFYLVSNTGEYLPPNEDSRVLKEDDTVVLIPGKLSDICNIISSKSENREQSPMCAGIVEQKKPVLVQLVSEVQKKSIIEDDHRDNDLSNTTGTPKEKTLYLSFANESQADRTSDVSATNQSSLMDDSTAETSQPRKRKRTRTKKRKDNTHSDPTLLVDHKAEVKKPKVTNITTIANGKHIRFSEIRNEDKTCPTNNVMIRDTNGSHSVLHSNENESDWSEPLKLSDQAKLSALLALRNSSTPITFSRKKKADDTKNTGTPKKTESKNTEPSSFVEPEHPIVVDPTKHPLMETKVRVNDIVAFKMLKMSNDYTPEVSNYIIAQPIQFSPNTSTYKFRIIEGQDQILGPQGKFEIESDEINNTETNTIDLTWSQLLEPRLIHSV